MKLFYPYLSALILTVVLESSALYLLAIRNRRDHLAMMLINIFALHISTVVLMLIAAATGLAVYLIKRRAGKGASE